MRGLIRITIEKKLIRLSNLFNGLKQGLLNSFQGKIQNHHYRE